MNKREIKNYLNCWDLEFSSSSFNKVIDSSSRRVFLAQLLAGSTTLIFSKTVHANLSKLNTPQWQTIAAVHLHMFPVGENEPDANSINATAYLKSVLEWPGVDEADKKFILNGVGWLDGITQKTFKQTFIQLNQNDKEMILRTIEKSQAGENWLSVILLYLIEALLTDPVYGGNSNGSGWQWLQHQPGFPRPPISKRYFNL